MNRVWWNFTPKQVSLKSPSAATRLLYPVIEKPKTEFLPSIKPVWNLRYMNLPLRIISVETLMGKRNMSEMDIFQIVLNHHLLPVNKCHPDEDWTEYSLEKTIYLFTWKEEYGNRSIIFRVSDIQKLERKLGGNLSKSDSIISGEELCKRWDLSMIEIESLIENSNLEVADPLGIIIKDFIIN